MVFCSWFGIWGAIYQLQVQVNEVGVGSFQESSASEDLSRAASKRAARVVGRSVTSDTLCICHQNGAPGHRGSAHSRSTAYLSCGQ